MTPSAVKQSQLQPAAMPPRGPTSVRVRRSRRRRDATRAFVLVLAVMLVAIGCSGDAATPERFASMSPAASPDASPSAAASLDPEGLCRRIDELELSLARLRAVELKLVNRVPLEIELGEVQLAFRELRAADLGELEEQLKGPLERLGYRLDEVELAVEDFRTTRRPQRAVPHVEVDTETFANDLTAFRVLSRC